MSQLKDDVLLDLSRRANVAQFVSFGPGPDPLPRHCVLRDGPEDARAFGAPSDGVAALLARSSGSVNVRSYQPERPKSREFHYGLTSVADAMSVVSRLASEGLHTIVNETIDVEDGGVSGVALGDVVEFVPGDTPRGVEEPGAASLSRTIAMHVLGVVYGFEPALDYKQGERVEFSIHPLRVGHRHEHTIVWELEDVGEADLKGLNAWPNRFSRFVGDKAFGLLMAEAVGLPVPRGTVVARNVAPFTFGTSTGTVEHWIRTCPVEQVPGKFTTTRGWTDPFELMQREDPDGGSLASVIAQEGVDARHSGATLPSDGQDQVEGVEGFGDRFMQGDEDPVELPSDVVGDVRALAATARARLGPVRLEWVHDGDSAWVVQMHLASESRAATATFYPGEASRWRRFDPAEGLDRLRKIIEEIADGDVGIEVTRPVGLTSHVGDLLRKARIPSRLAR